MSVFDRNVQHWARMDNPLNPIKKLAKDALKISGELVILDTLLHPIVQIDHLQMLDRVLY